MCNSHVPVQHTDFYQILASVPEASLACASKIYSAGFCSNPNILTSKCFHKITLLVDFLDKCINICFFSVKVQIFIKAACVRLMVSLHLFFSGLV